MTLHIIEPFAITETNIDSTNVALETAWTAGTYTLGDVRRVGERLFEVSAASTTQEPGLAASTQWLTLDRPTDMQRLTCNSGPINSG